jgi:hypothetical protein
MTGGHMTDIVNNEIAIFAKAGLLERVMSIAALSIVSPNSCSDPNNSGFRTTLVLSISL